VALRLADTTTSLTRNLHIVDDFSVTVRHLGRRELEDLVRRLDGLDDNAAALESARAYLADWQGCTVTACRKIGVNVADDQPVGPDGTIPFDAETARDLWRHAFPDVFMNPVIRFSRRILEAVEEEKRRSKNVSGASSAPSTTP